ncbi:BnaC07g04270D [Brassica napus]|uniref:(rape) hypothetical protein n=1 Tax=Brassica napus TaxID=3708 RepID=A0A078G0C5_BRANA|nr:unnamed protein product [Brassica napus]CDY18043.1 BnaC07g04270D [Brassica napus]
MAKIWEKHTFSLRFLIDEKKNRVVLAEAGKDFVDVLCGILTLPMGTIVSLLEKHKNPQSSIVGCFHNLHRSVSIMDDDNFQTQACKNLLMHPKSMKEAQCRQLKTSSIITDYMKVALNSMGLVLNILNDRGYSGFDKLREMVLDVVCSLRSSLEDTFLRKHCVMTRKRKTLTPLVQETRVAGEDECLTPKVLIRKFDREILYVECREDFVDFLFSFLAIPLEFAWELSIDDANLGCVGNLRRSVKELSFEKQKEAIISKCVLPHCYSFRAQLLDIKKTVLGDGLKIVKVSPVSASVGTNFIVSDDPVVAPMNSSSTVSLLSKLQLSIGDIEEHLISIGKNEAIIILRASLITTSALINGFSNFLFKMKPEEAKQLTKKDKIVGRISHLVTWLYHLLSLYHISGV